MKFINGAHGNMASLVKETLLWSLNFDGMQTPDVYKQLLSIITVIEERNTRFERFKRCFLLGQLPRFQVHSMQVAECHTSTFNGGCPGQVLQSTRDDNGATAQHQPAPKTDEMVCAHQIFFFFFLDEKGRSRFCKRLYLAGYMG
jgi:hypothetical protein